ncbi:MAG: DUF2207 family protein [Actinomycetota bacterium]
MRRFLVTLALIGVVLGLAPSGIAQEKYFYLPQAEIQIDVQPDGSVEVTERITFSFSGSFSGAFRDIPVGDGQAVTDISVSEGGRRYAPGASAELGSSGAPDTFGVDYLGEAVRVVWHYSANYEMRTFDLSYRLEGAAVAYDDVVDVNMQVWGDEWEVELGSLHAVMRLPEAVPFGEPDAPSVRVWGHPASVDGTVYPLPDNSGAELWAGPVKPGYFTEMRVVFPRSVLTSTSGAKVVAGEGLEDILAEERALVEATQRDRERIDWFKRNLAWLIPLLLLLAAVPAAASALFIWRRHGREHPAPPLPEHIHEPPGGEKPALVAALLSEGHNKVTGDAFAATLFDLIRRRHLDAMPAMTVKKTWAGLRQEDVSDLRVTLKEVPPAQDQLTPFETQVMKAVKKAAGSDGTLMLSEFKDEIKSSPKYYADRFRRFREEVSEELKRVGWWETAGLKPLIWTMIAMGLLAVGSFWLALKTSDPVQGFPWATLIFGFLAAAFLLNELALVVFLVIRRGWERRSAEAAVEASKWKAFRNFLNDFEGIPQAVPGSISVWEQFLVYGIALGIAERVLAAAQLYAPPELATSSPVFWISPDGNLGSGASAFAIGDISSAVASAAAPSASGGGGGFSGGGGGGFGGGGGGAW